MTEMRHDRQDMKEKRKNRGWTVYRCRVFPRVRITIPSPIARLLTTMASKFLGTFMCFFGPLLILLAVSIIVGLTTSFFKVLLPLSMEEPGSILYIIHIAFAMFLLCNVSFNYALCVCTTNDDKSHKYNIVVRELAAATGYDYPESGADLKRSKHEYEEKLMDRRQKKLAPQSNVFTSNHAVDSRTFLPSTLTAASMLTAAEEGSANFPDNSHNSFDVAGRNKNSGECPSHSPISSRLSQIVDESRSTTAALNNTPNSAVSKPSPGQTAHAWTLLGSEEWGFCSRTNKPKPPRSHFDSVTGTLVMNMDHYCPWMFNTVGYFNYRYFCNFLFYVFVATAYGTIMSFKPFYGIDGEDYRNQIKMSRAQHVSAKHLIPYVAIPSERLTVCMSFMLCVSIGCAVATLLGFHIYLILTGHTTIEFHASLYKRRIAKRRGMKYMHPYDLGLQRNWEQVYGTQNPVLALLPSTREPEFLPVAIPGDKGYRWSSNKHRLKPEDTAIFTV